VDSARSGETGLKALAERRPDAVVIDPVLPGSDIFKLVQDLRASGGARPTPVIVLPTARPALSEVVQEAGADVVLLRSVNPLVDVIDAVQTKLGLEKTSALARGLAFRADDGWLKMSLGAAPETLTSLRRALHEASRENGDPTALPELYQYVHGFAEQMAILGQRPLHYLAAQIEALAHDLSKYPEQINPSVLRTLGQSVDFLSTLLPDAMRNRLKDPGAAQVLVVDDEDGARKIIMASMRLANLKSMAADTPSTGLAALGVQGFDLIFLDVGLPEMNGFELCAKIRALPMHEKTPVIFITGMATFQNRVQSSLSGGNDFVGKPFSIPELGLKALIWIFKGQLGQI
jgi:DNA-binding response OmpR family regulator